MVARARQSPGSPRGLWMPAFAGMTTFGDTRAAVSRYAGIRVFSRLAKLRRPDALAPCAPERIAYRSLVNVRGRNAGDVHQSGRGLFGRKRGRDRHDQLAAGQCAVAGRPRRSEARDRAGGGRPRRQGDRDPVRRAHLHCRRRHHRVRQAARRALPARRARQDRERQEAGDRRAAWHGARRRLRGGADGALPDRRPLGQVRPAGDQARPHPRRRRHPAAAAPRRPRESARRHPLRNAVRRP